MLQDGSRLRLIPPPTQIVNVTRKYYQTLKKCFVEGSWGFVLRAQDDSELNPEADK